MSRFPLFSPILLFLIFAITPLTAQSLLEEKILDNSESIDNEELREKLDHLQRHPVDLNSARPSTLAELPLLSPLIASAICRERRRHGIFLSWADFLSRLNLSESFRNLYHPFCIIKKPSSQVPEMEARYRLSMRRNNYTDQPDSPLKSYERFSFDPSPVVSGRLLIEKDAGEKDWLDHITGFTQIELPSIKSELIAGDYIVKAGQGLVLWSPYASIKGYPMRPAGRELKGYSSTDENKFFRGLALRSQWRGLWLLAFASRKKIDASLDSIGVITGFPDSGYHRTPGEMERRKSTGETSWGLRLIRSSSIFTVGLTHLSYGYSHPIFMDEQSRPAGTFQHVSGLDLEVNLIGLTIRTECACTGGRPCFITTGLTSIAAVEFLICLHCFPPGYANRHGNALFYGTMENHQGIFFSATIDMKQAGEISWYLDLFRSPESTESFPLSSEGLDLMTRYKRKLSRTIDASLRFRHRINPDIISINPIKGGDTKAVVQRYKNQVRFSLTYQPLKILRLRGRFEAVHTGFTVPACLEPSETDNDWGLLVFEDSMISVGKRWMLNGRVTLFHTSSYISRIYQFENDVPGLGSIPSYYGKGLSVYLLIRFKAKRMFSLNIKTGLMRRQSENEDRVALSSWAHVQMDFVL